jgi:hypothetical protein
VHHVRAASYGLLFATDDRVAFTTASRPPANVCTMRTTALVVAMVRVGWISDADGWTALQAMDQAGRRLGEFPWTDATAFASECGAAH